MRVGSVVKRSSSIAQTQRRRHVRYNLRLAVICCWTSDSEEKRTSGYTRDIGAGGMFVISGETPPVNVTVECTVQLERNNGSSDRLAASGRVVRVQSLSRHASGFAIVNDSGFLSGSHSASQ